MKSPCESADGHKAVTMGLRLAFPLFHHSSIYFHDSPSGLWAGNLSNTTSCRDRRRYYRACYYFTSLEERVEWSDCKTGRRDGGRYRRLASLSGLADKHRRTSISIRVPTDRRRCGRFFIPLATDDKINTTSRLHLLPVCKYPPWIQSHHSACSIYTRTAWNYTFDLHSIFIWTLPWQGSPGYESSPWRYPRFWSCRFQPKMLSWCLKKTLRNDFTVIFNPKKWQKR